MRVIAVIGDIVDSRAISKREVFQSRLIRELARTNATGHPAAHFSLSSGDEVEAVYIGASFLFEDLLEISAATYPHRIRFSIALGRITTAIHRDNPLVMDGPAFHIA